MQRHISRGLALAALLLLALTGCVTFPEPQAFNREAHTNIKNVSVLESRRTEVRVFMLNNPGASFGLIGGLIAAADEASKEKTFRATLAKTGFDPYAYFKERLTAKMGEKGYTLVWPQAQVETAKAERESVGLRKNYGAIQTADAQLDVNLDFVGYAAAGAGAGSPYRPTVTASVRLVSADGKQNLFTDFITYNNVFNLQKSIVLSADPAKYSYPRFNDLDTAGNDAVEGLKIAIDSVAGEIARQL
jgi:hypothetical protein